MTKLKSKKTSPLQYMWAFVVTITGAWLSWVICGQALELPNILTSFSVGLFGVLILIGAVALATALISPLEEIPEDYKGCPGCRDNPDTCRCLNS